ncbi:P-loop containing nucleoside triphosphate hydrolase protein [Fistulina hepatica ATCC 64428]|uniref:RNA helicase n=1 Tax=Fistulina hepatica ATCC 64428 TaxID=1128425 RepID=A0A0D7AJP7_9AGAR|nr:P-loop containing nucleoside triphosphate hydrolase protein [Fistulina hepatica ATCC 64428]
MSSKRRDGSKKDVPEKDSSKKQLSTKKDSSKSKSSGSTTPVQESKEKPLFPPGSKTPLSLLHERCQRNGWDKPTVDARKRDGGFSFVITLSRVSKKGEKETVRLEPHPSRICPSAIEARHWGATYALYRFCNGIQLNRVLPAGPRDYWNELVAEHRDIPEHLKWQYAADPFAARREVDERQAKAAARREKKQEDDARPSGPTREFSNAPEVFMSNSLRDVVEDAVKKGLAMYPEAASPAAPTVLSPEDTPALQQQLVTLGFKPPQAQDAINLLSGPSAVAVNLLSTLSPLDACIEYLVLHVPECDLPPRFLPSASSNMFISSIHTGDHDLKRRWVEDKAVKEAGWPAHAVKASCASDPTLVDDWTRLITTLGMRLTGAGDDWRPDDEGEPYEIDAEEVTAFGGQVTDPGQVDLPLFSAPITLHIITSSAERVPRARYVPMYITSPSVSAYVRLHLVAQVLRTASDGTLQEPGESFCMACLRVIQEEWAKIEDNGPPDMHEVLRHILPRAQLPVQDIESDESPVPSRTSNKRKPRTQSQISDDRSDEQVRREFEGICGMLEYKAMLEKRQKLPAFDMRDKFLAALDHNRVVVVVGDTGCGKTTQLPQFILDALILANKGASTSILITQPRRISAISVAERVSTERLDDGSVGYATRGESKHSRYTKLLFCTTGVVLRRLSSGDNLKDVSHIFVDEVHERSVDGDFLLLELKDLLTKHPRLKVVLMSATINHETFVRYFHGAHLITIQGRAFSVTDVYLEDVLPRIQYRPPASTYRGVKEASVADREALKSRGLDDAMIHALQSIVHSGRLDYQLIAAIVEHIVKNEGKPSGILIFLPGVEEIRQCIDAIKSVMSPTDANIYPLHANLTSDEHRRVFLETSKWKIVVTTNVAETSITINDIVYVIDSGKVKEIHYDPAGNITRLEETWVTRAAARQRRGRAGRTQAGFCYKLFTRPYEEKMVQFPVPEILRVPLESISLSVKVTREEEDVKEFLRRAIDPPDVSSLDRAWKTLQEIGAIDANNGLTGLGRHMAMLPVDLKIGKMLVLGAVFRCIAPILTIAALLQSKPLFLSPVDKRDEAKQARLGFATDDSDLLTDLAAYDAVMELRMQRKGSGALRAFCEKNFISANTIREVRSLRQDLFVALCDLGFIPFSSSPSAHEFNANSRNNNLIKAIILGGSWPNVARAGAAMKFDRMEGGAVQRENTAKEFKLREIKGERVFLHPSSILFDHNSWKSPFLTYFSKQLTSKLFVRDASQVPTYAVLLFGGPIWVNHIRGGLIVGNEDGRLVLNASPRIGTLVNQLRRIFDARLQRCINDGTPLRSNDQDAIVSAMLELLASR